jgi:hypothetical protein
LIKKIKTKFSVTTLKLKSEKPRSKNNAEKQQQKKNNAAQKCDHHKKVAIHNIHNIHNTRQSQLATRLYTF